MVIAVLADEQLQNELLSKNIPENSRIVWADSLQSLGIIDADVFMDLQFRYDHERIARLARLLPKPVFVSSIVYTIKDIGHPFVRINAWPTMLGRNSIELAGSEQTIQDTFGLLGWKYKVVPDIPGMITPRIVSMIFNEAYFTLADGVSTKEEIDTAMKLGTSYPFGPFEWSEKIGIARVKTLLHELGRLDSRYTIAPALMTEN